MRFSASYAEYDDADGIENSRSAVEKLRNDLVGSSPALINKTFTVTRADEWALALRVNDESLYSRRLLFS